jgi:hypothetical protein
MNLDLFYRGACKLDVNVKAKVKDTPWPHVTQGGGEHSPYFHLWKAFVFGFGRIGTGGVLEIQALVDIPYSIAGTPSSNHGSPGRRVGSQSCQTHQMTAGNITELTPGLTHIANTPASTLQTFTLDLNLWFNSC